MTEPRLELMRRRLAAIGGDHASAETVAAPTRPGGFGVAENRMWRIYQLDPESVSHNIALVLEFGDGYTAESVVAAFELLIREADVLGSIVALDTDGVPHRTPHRPHGRWIESGALWEWGVHGIPPLTDIHTAAQTLACTPFRLTHEPPVRARVHGRPRGATMILVVHHLAVDDTSWPLLLGALLSGAWPDLPDTAPTTDHDPAALERALRHARRTWAAEDVRFPLTDSLPTIDPAQSWLSPMEDGEGTRLTRTLEPDHVTALDSVSRELGATVNAVLVGLCALGVYAITGAADHVLLVPTDNRRPGARPDRVGYSGNIVPMRFAFDPNASVREAMRRAVSVVYDSMEFATVDYGAILTAIRRAGGRFPVAEIMASVRNAPLRNVPTPHGSLVTCESVSHGLANYPLTLTFEIRPDDSVRLEVDYRNDVCTADFAERAASILTALVARTPAALGHSLSELVRAAEPT
nr:condensation domain-containing protein [Nocardia bovistercoris]